MLMSCLEDWGRAPHGYATGVRLDVVSASLAVYIELPHYEEDAIVDYS